MQAQVETKGTDFWLTFGKVSGHKNASEVILQIRIVAEEAAKVTIKYAEVTNPITVNVAANSVVTHTLSAGEKVAAYATTFNFPEKKSVHIQTDVPVSIYALSEAGLGEALADATNILPTPVLGTDYYHLGRKTENPTSDKYDQYVVVATQDGTEVYDNGTKRATLNTGQTYLLQGDDMSGHHITSNKPIAYFSAHTYCIISGGGDNFFQQLAPVNTWGKNFMVPVTNREIELIRVVASQNNTTITQTGGTIMTITGGQNSLTLNAGQWVELKTTIANKGCYIQADKPVQVCAYMVGGKYDGAVNTSGGDESICLVPAIEQSMEAVLMAPFGLSNMQHHFALIVTPTATKNNTTLSIGGAAATGLTGAVWHDNSASGMSFCNITLTQTNDSYFFENQAGLIVYGYGFGPAISYYYMAGSAMRDLDTSFYVNDIHHQDLPDFIFQRHNTDFEANINAEMSKNAGHLKWHVGENEMSAGRDRITWDTWLPDGDYNVRMEVLLSDNKTVKIVESILHIKNEIDGEVCENSSINLVATVEDGGASPNYQWQINGVDVEGATQSTYTYTPTGEDGDIVIITCVLIYDNLCSGTGTVISNEIKVKVNPLISNSVTISESDNNICSDTEVTFTATPDSDDPSISYQWKKNGEIIPEANNSTYTYTPANGDVITCETTFGSPCATPPTATSNSINMVVSPSGVDPSITIRKK